MKEKVLIILAIVLPLCSLFLDIYIWFNLVSYSVYYAHRMPHAKGINPELVMTIKYLGNIRILEDKGIRIDQDGNNILIKDEQYVISYDYKFKDKEIITLAYFFKSDEQFRGFS